MQGSGVSAKQLAIAPQGAGAVASSPQEASLTREIREAWVECRAAVATGNKLALRRLHLNAKRYDASVDYNRLRKALRTHCRYFPSASRIEPERIDPIVVPIRADSLEETLFKITRAYWSMPYSKGYGRRLRFLVMDQFHGAVIGIIGLQSPSADLACRDEYFDVAKDKKLQVINNTLDAYTVGATPTYAPLLAGKLVAGLLHSPIIRQEYWRTYGDRRTTQLNRRIPQPLLAITTASAFGRSTIYNRLRDRSRLLAKPLGYTKGFGTLHLEALYPKMVEWLRSNERLVPAGFGNGPKVRWQNIMHTLIGLGISRKHLEHGVQRQVFIFELAHNLLEVCRNGALPDIATFDDRSWADHWKARWCLPRANRKSDWYEFDTMALFEAALSQPDATRLSLARASHSLDPGVQV